MATKTLSSYKVTLTWVGGKVETGIGWGVSREEAAADFMNSKGYGGGAIRALHSWDAEKEEVAE